MKNQKDNKYQTKIQENIIRQTQKLSKKQSQPASEEICLNQITQKMAVNELLIPFAPGNLTQLVVYDLEDQSPIGEFEGLSSLIFKTFYNEELQKQLIYCYLVFQNEQFASKAFKEIQQSGFKIIYGKEYQLIYHSHIIIEPIKNRKDVIDRIAQIIQQPDQSQILAKLKSEGQDLSFMNLNSSEHTYLRYILQKVNSQNEWVNLDGKYYKLLSLSSKKIQGIAVLTNDKRIELINKIGKLDGRRITIIELSYFCLQNAVMSNDITLSLTQAFSSFQLNQQLQLLFVLNDILHNSSLHHEFFWLYRICWEECLPFVFESINKTIQSTKNGDEEKFIKQKINIILDTWKTSGIYDKKYINGLQITLNCNLTNNFYSNPNCEINEKLSVFENKILNLNTDQLNEMCKIRGLIYFNSKIQAINRLMNYKAYKLNLNKKHNTKQIDIEGVDLTDLEITQIIQKEQQVFCNQDMKYLQHRQSKIENSKVDQKLAVLQDPFYPKDQIQTILQCI